MMSGWARREDEAAGLPARTIAAAAANDSHDSFADATRAAHHAEQRALAAVGRLADEVARLGEALNRRMDSADVRASEGLDAVRAEVRHLEALVARRLADSELVHDQSLRALQAAIAEVADRLSERMDEVERAAARSAEAVSRRVEQMEARVEGGHARLLSEFDSRTGASEARLRRLIAQFGAELGAPPARRSPGMPPLIAAILVLAAGAATVSLGAVGYQLAAGSGATPAVRVRLPALPLRPRLGFELPATRRTAPVTAPIAPTPAPRSTVTTPAETADYAAIAEAAVKGDRQALARLQALASGGAPVAQLLLGKLYEDGQGGLLRDMAQARAWTQRAAEGGERSAMHNLALFLVNGEGGAVDAPAAARWFEKAAVAGVVDAQFNLGLLYEAGRGVPRNLALAYRWYSIAANAGDLVARGRAVALEPRLTPAERTAASRAAVAFEPGRAQAQAAGAPLLSGAATVAETQRLLARGGYYIGDTDGADNPSYRTALQAYVRDHPTSAQPAAQGEP